MSPFLGHSETIPQTTKISHTKMLQHELNVSYLVNKRKIKKCTGNPETGKGMLCQVLKGHILLQMWQRTGWESPALLSKGITGESSVICGISNMPEEWITRYNSSFTLCYCHSRKPTKRMSLLATNGFQLLSPVSVFRTNVILHSPKPHITTFLELWLLHV